MNSNQSPILANSIVGFEFEFFSDYDKNKVKESLSTHLGRRILPFDKKEDSTVKATGDVFKLTSDYSGGKSMLELSTGPVSYYEARLILSRTLRWLREHATTNEKSSVQLNVSFDKSLKGGVGDISKMNILKFVLDVDEEFIYSKFPNRRDSNYARSIKSVLPLNKLKFMGAERIEEKNYALPIGKYYGVNFKKLSQGYVEMRYLGGTGYENKENDIVEVLDYFINTLKESTFNSTFDDSHLKSLNAILTSHREVIESYSSPALLELNFTDLKLLVDLDENQKIIELQYPRFRDQLFKLLTHSKLRNGTVNYDSNRGRLQLKDCDLTENNHISDVDIIGGKISGLITKCDIFESEIENGHVLECNLFLNSKVSESRVRNCYSNKTCTLEDCYIFGKNSIINGKVNRGIFVDGKVTNLTEFIDTEIIEFKKIS